MPDIHLVVLGLLGPSLQLGILEEIKKNSTNVIFSRVFTLVFHDRLRCSARTNLKIRLDILNENGEKIWSSGASSTVSCMKRPSERRSNELESSRGKEKMEKSESLS